MHTQQHSKGGGQMGTGIAFVTALRAQKPVVLVDVSKAQLEKSEAFIHKLMDKEVAKERITAAEAAAALARFSTADDVAAFANTDFVVEAVSESLDLKLKLFEQMDVVTPKHAILASNTSSISITAIAAATQRPSQIVGMHFMNPVPVMKLVEVIAGLRGSEETMATTLALAAEMGKTTTVSKDVPGFIANRLLMPYINEAVYALQEGIMTRDDIDTTMKLGCNMPMGPLTLADFIGLDTCLAVRSVVVLCVRVVFFGACNCFLFFTL
jgi:3-hydroxybutyryl-CoA dehydrogenase